MTRARTRHLAIERLEDRTVLAAFAVPWPEASQLTLSFAPDGTMAGSQASALFRTLNSQAPTEQWKLEVLRAFQTWADESSINIGVVADGGQPFGTLGLKEGDPRFGDIRIGAYPMASDVLAVADPYDPFVANTWVGDVFLNSSYSFDSRGAGTAYDLFSVLLHEAGHVLGIGHSSDPNSPMFEQFHNGMNLTSADVAALRSLYGVRPADAFEGPQGNDSLSTATLLDLGESSDGAAALTVEADIGSLADVDYYRFQAPEGTSSIDFRVKASGVSLLTPRLGIFDAAGTELASTMSVDPLHNNVKLSLDHVQPGKTYYVRVAGARSDVFGIGSYHLTVDPHSSDGGPLVATSTRGDSSISSQDATQGSPQILATSPGYVEHTYYDMEDTFSSTVDTHTYQVRSADLGPGMTNVMTVAISGPYDPAVRYNVSIVDDQGNTIATSVIADRPGHFAVQALSVQSNRDYFVQIRSAQPVDGEVEYYMVADFAQDAEHLQTFVNDSLDRAQYQALRTLQVVQSQEFHFVLAASDWNVPTETGVRMNVFDSAGQLVYSMAAADGATRAGDVFLNHGNYTVQFTRMAADVDTPVIFQLSGTTLSDPLGPQLRDTTQEPVDSPAASALPQLTFYWLPLNNTNAAAAAQSLGITRSGSQSPRAGGASVDNFIPQASEISEAGALHAAVLTHGAVGLTGDASGIRLATIASPTDAQYDPLADLLQYRRESLTAVIRATAPAADSRPAPLHDQATVAASMPLVLSSGVESLSDESPQMIRWMAGEQPPDDTAALRHRSARDIPDEPITSRRTGGFSDQFFAWLEGLRAGDYAAWMFAPICITLGWYAVRLNRPAARSREVAGAQAPRPARHCRVRPVGHPIGLRIG